MTWYEWGIYILKLYKDAQRRVADQELSIEQTRQFMALFANANRDKNQPAYTPQDFWKLSYDDKGEEYVNASLSLKDIKEKLGSRLKKDVK